MTALPIRKRCLTCRTSVDRASLKDGRCPQCQVAHDHERNARRTQYQGEWQALRRRILTAHRAEYGDWCPGDEYHHSHASSDLTVDHHHDGTTTVNCRSGNGRRGALDPVFAR